MSSIDVRGTLNGAHIVLTGATGFLGKVWLSFVLYHVPEIGRVTLLMRGKKGRTPAERLVDVFAKSHAMQPLYERHGDTLGAWLAERVDVVEGDLMRPNLGIADEDLDRLAGDVDLVVNCAGLVDFDPDVRDALGTNVYGPQHLAAVARRLDVPFIHVSTCFAAGTREGRIPEVIHVDRRPDDEPWDVEKELARVERAIDRRLKRLAKPEALQVAEDSARRYAAIKGVDPDDPDDADAWAEILRDAQRREEVEAMRADGHRAAERCAFPNTYTWSKGLGEALLATRHDDLAFTVVRPAIVESALSYPFAGWNEGFNTCGPLSYLVGTWFKHMPGRRDNPFDVVPVDLVARALTTVAAARIRGTAPRVVQVGTSDFNLLTIDRALELTQLYHRRRLRTEGRTAVDRLLRSRWDTTGVHPEHAFSPASMRGVAKAVRGALKGLPKGTPKPVRIAAADAAHRIKQADRPLKKLQRVVELFRPFTHDLHQEFVGGALRALVPTEDTFAYAPEQIDWRRYWFEVQMPGLQKWSFPVLRGEDPPAFEPPVPLNWPGVSKEAAE